MKNLSHFENVTFEELSLIDGGGCSWQGAGNATVSGAVGGAIGGAFGGSVTLPVIGTVAGWAAGGILGGAGSAVAYGATCWW